MTNKELNTYIVRLDSYTDDRGSRMFNQRVAIEIIKNGRTKSELEMDIGEIDCEKLRLLRQMADENGTVILNEIDLTDYQGNRVREGHIVELAYMEWFDSSYYFIIPKDDSEKKVVLAEIQSILEKENDRKISIVGDFLLSPYYEQDFIVHKDEVCEHYVTRGYFYPFIMPVSTNKVEPTERKCLFWLHDDNTECKLDDELADPNLSVEEFHKRVANQANLLHYSNTDSYQTVFGFERSCDEVAQIRESEYLPKYL